MTRPRCLPTMEAVTAPLDLQAAADRPSPFGRQVLAELMGCDEALLADHAAVERLMNDAARAAGALSRLAPRTQGSRRRSRLCTGIQLSEWLLASVPFLQRVSVPGSVLSRIASPQACLQQLRLPRMVPPGAPGSAAVLLLNLNGRSAVAHAASNCSSRCSLSP